MASLGHNKLKLCHFKYLSVFWVCLPVTIQCLTILYRSYCVGEWVYRIVWLTGKDIHAPWSRLIVTPLVNRLCALWIMIFSLQYAIAFLLWNKLLFLMFCDKVDGCCVSYVNFMAEQNGLLYPPKRSLGGVYWIHPVRPSVCLSVCLSVRPSVRGSVSG